MTLWPVTVETHRPRSADMPSRLGSDRPESAQRRLDRREVVGIAAACTAGVSSQRAAGGDSGMHGDGVMCVHGGRAMTGSCVCTSVTS